MPASGVFGQFISASDLGDKSLHFELNLRNLCLRNSSAGKVNFRQHSTLVQLPGNISVKENN